MYVTQLVNAAVYTQQTESDLPDRYVYSHIYCRVQKYMDSDTTFII